MVGVALLPIWSISPPPEPTLEFVPPDILFAEKLAAIRPPRKKKLVSASTTITSSPASPSMRCAPTPRLITSSPSPAEITFVKLPAVVIVSSPPCPNTMLPLKLAASVSKPRLPRTTSTASVPSPLRLRVSFPDVPTITNEVFPPITFAAEMRWLVPSAVTVNACSTSFAVILPEILPD